MKRRNALLGGLAVAAGAGVGGYYFGRDLVALARRVVGPGKTGTSVDKINHVVVLMLENRSFDNILGKLYPKSAAFDGLSGNETNPDLAGNPVPVRNIPGAGTPSITNPTPDPGELFSDINEQIFGTPTPRPGQTPTMDGFVRNFLRQPDVTPSQYDELARRIMHYYEPEQVPVISQLARQFAVSDRWFAPAPCQTWPNRYFMHTGTAGGFENNEPYHLLEVPSIFDSIEQTMPANSWAIYMHDFALALNLPRLWLRPLNFFAFSDFLNDARNGTLPAYAFIEPRYLPDADLPNDQHPPHGVTAGEQLIADTYNALRAGPNWTSTLLIIIYDEHGGCYDHVAPPPATPPDKVASSPFNFDRYGVRVPAVIVSPYIKPNTIMRPAAPGAAFDHTSILATLRKRFGLKAPLTLRDAAASDLASVPGAWLPTPDNLGPEHISALPAPDVSTRLEAMKQSPVSDLQQSILHINSQLPQPDVVVTDHIERRHAMTTAAPVKPTTTAGQATEMVRPTHAKLRNFRLK